MFWGGLTTILSKEYFVPWVDTPEHLVFLGALIAFSKIYAPKISEILDKKIKESDDAYVQELNDSTKRNIFEIFALFFYSINIFIFNL